MIATNKTIFTCISDRSDDGKVFGHFCDENCTVNNVTWAKTFISQGNTSVSPKIMTSAVSVKRIFKHIKST